MHTEVIVVSSDEGVAIPLWHAFARCGTRAEVIPFSPFALQQLKERILPHGRVWALVVDAARETARAAALIRDLRAAFAGMPVLAALDAPGARAVQGVLAAGACDFLTHPFDEAQMAACRDAWAGVRVADVNRGGLVCFLPARPGDGASTVALHAAQASAGERRRRGVKRGALFVDFDFHAGSVAFRLRIDPPGTLADALSGPDPVDPPWHRIVCPWRDLEILAAPGATLRDSQLARLEALFSAARQSYALVVVDMPAPVFSSSEIVLRAADEVHLVCTPDPASVHLARRRVSELLDIGVAPPRLRLVLNRAGSHSWIGAEEVSLAVGLPVSAALTNDYAATTAASVKGQVVSPRSKLGRQIKALGLRIGASENRPWTAAA